MDSINVERRNTLLQELSHILVELEEISIAQKVKEKSIDLAVILEHPCQLTIEVKEQENPPDGDN